MKCISCQKGDTRVIDSRPEENGFGVVRQRVCMTCKHKFVTHESVFDPRADRQSKRERYARYRVNRGDQRRAQQREYQAAKRAAKALGITIAEVRAQWAQAQHEQEQRKEQDNAAVPVA